MEKAGKVKGNSGKKKNGGSSKGPKGPKRKPGRPRKNPLPVQIEEPEFGEEGVDETLPAWDSKDFQEKEFQEKRGTEGLGDLGDEEGDALPETLAEDEELRTLCDQYYKLLDDNPQLRLLDEFVEVDPLELGPQSLRREIFRLTSIVNAPFWNFVYSKIWQVGTEILEAGLQRLPQVGERFSTVPTPQCPRPVSIAKVLQHEDVMKEVGPFFEELRETVPFLNSIAGLASPKYRLAFSVSMAVKDVYTHNAPNPSS